MAWATLQSGGREPVTLGPDLVTVPAANTIVLIYGADSSQVRLDGVRVSIPETEPAALLVDLTRSVGFHQLDLGGGESFWFATDDAKLRLDGVLSMLRDLRSDGTGWSGQIFFSDGTGLRDPHVVFAWLNDNMSSILTAARGVNDAPIRASVAQFKTTNPSGKHVDVRRTLALLRTRPNDLLERVHDRGSLAIGGEHFNPRRVVSTQKFHSLDTTWNRRFVRLLSSLLRLSREVHRESGSAEVRARCTEWSNAIQSALAHPTAREIRRFAITGSDARHPVSNIEASDRRYRILYRSSRQLDQEFGWSPTTTRHPSYSYVEYSDSVYQAWVATRFARALGATRNGPSIGPRQPAFTSPLHDIYFDSVPPPAVLATWRVQSNTPDALRPDLPIVERATGRVALFDAKYRVHIGRATEDSRKEVSSYMASFGLDGVGIAYPGPSSASVIKIEALGQRILEVPLSPGGSTSDGALNAAIEAVMQKPAFPVSN